MAGNKNKHNNESVYVYFVIQRQAGYRHLDLKIGHSKNPTRRVYSYRDICSEAWVVHTIETDSKVTACELERGFVRVLKNNQVAAYEDHREWFRYTDEAKEILKSWGVCHEMV